MEISRVRKADYWIGIPACFILSVHNKFQNVFFPRKIKKIRPQKIMFLELSEIGSVILAYSAMKKVKEIFSNAEVYFWIFRKNQDSVHVLNIIPKENVITMRNENPLLLLIDTIRNLWKIWKAKIDVIIDMELFSRFPAILSYLSGAHTKVGFHKFCLEGLYRGDLHTLKVSYNPYLHISKNFLALVYALVAPAYERPLVKVSLDDYETTVPKIKLSGKTKEKIWNKLKEINYLICEKNKIIILNPGINEILPLRRWPIKNYIELAKRLLADPEIFIVLIGSEPKCFNKAKELIYKEFESSRIIDLIGRTTIDELLALYNISSLLVSHDSGATNLASLTDINIVVLFGPETPMLYGPLSPNKTVLYAGLSCSPCFSAYNHRRSICNNNKCIQEISIEEVYYATKLACNGFKK